MVNKSDKSLVHTHRRRGRRLVHRELQLRLAFAIVGSVGLALALQFVLFSTRMSALVFDMPTDPVQAYEYVSSASNEALWFASAVTLPLALFVGILASFRFAGPLVAITRYFEDLANGERRGELSLRDGDRLGELAELVNRAMAAQQATAPRTAAPVPAPAESADSTRAAGDDDTRRAA